MKKGQDNFVKIKSPLEIYYLDSFLIDRKDYPVGAIVLTKFKKSPRHITKKGHYKCVYKTDLVEENMVGLTEKKKKYLWVRVK